jgi:hypothetical protein
MGITEIAVFATMLFMAFSALASIASNRGYAFDLRRAKARRRNTRPGGRRMDDAIIS